MRCMHAEASLGPESSSTLYFSMGHSRTMKCLHVGCCIHDPKRMFLDGVAADRQLYIKYRYIGTLQSSDFFFFLRLTN